MANLEQFQAKICLTVAAVLIHEGQALLIKHKKLGIWLNPGGHIEVNEPPHQAAEREFWEETHLKVRAISWEKLPTDEDSQYLPSPISTNLHWASRQNYEARLANPTDYQIQKQWTRGCEQHLNFLYLVEPVGSLDFEQNEAETDGIAWFDLSKIDDSDLIPSIKTDLKIAQEYFSHYVK